MVSLAEMGSPYIREGPECTEGGGWGGERGRSKVMKCLKTLVHIEGTQNQPEGLPLHKFEHQHKLNKDINWDCVRLY